MRGHRDSKWFVEGSGIRDPSFMPSTQCLKVSGSKTILRMVFGTGNLDYWCLDLLDSARLEDCVRSHCTF